MIQEAEKHLLRENLTRYYKESLGVRNWESFVQDRLSLKFEKEYLERFENIRLDNEFGVSLDVGTGWGGVLYLKRDQHFYGIEPDFELCKLAANRLKSFEIDCRILKAVGEFLPFKDNSFTYVTCYTVLEHCKEPYLVVKEMVRVLKPGGLLHLIIPNYFGWYEGHYKIFYPPMLPKPLGRVYLLLRNRPTKFINHINYINTFAIRRWLNRLPVTFSHAQELYYKERFKDFTKVRGKTKKLLLSIANRICFASFAEKIVLWLFTNFVHHSAEFVIRKKGI